MRALDLKPCKFSFEDTETHDGFTDGTTWNGWDNVWVTPEVHAKLIADMGDAAEGELGNMEPVDGLISYAGGYCTTIETDEVDPMDLHEAVDGVEEKLNELSIRLEHKESESAYNKRELEKSRRLFMELYDEQRTLKLRFNWLEIAATEAVQACPEHRNDMLIRLCDELGLPPEID